MRLVVRCTESPSSPAKSCFPQTRVARVSHSRRLEFISERFRASDGERARDGFARRHERELPGQHSLLKEVSRDV